MKKTIISVSIFTALLNFSQSASVQEIEGHAEFNTGNVFTTPRTKTLGDNKVTQVWKDTSNTGRYYFTPAILPEWGAYSKTVKEECSQNQNNESIDVDLEIVLDNEEYRSELVRKINDYINTAIDDKTKAKKITNPDAQLYPIPYHELVISLRPKGEESILLYHSRAAENSYTDKVGYSTTQKVGMDKIMPAKIGGSCDFHHKIVDAVTNGQSDLISGELYRTGAVYNITKMEHQYILEVLQALQDKIFSNEKVTINASSKGKGKGFSMNIPLLKGSAGSSTTTNSATIEGLRVVNREFIQNALENIMSSSRLTCDGIRCNDLLETIIDKIFSQNADKAYLSRNAENNSYELVAEQIGYVTPMPIKDDGVKMELDNIFYMKNKDEVTEEAKIGEKGLSAEKNQTTENEIKQTSNATLDNVPLANKVDLQIVSKDFFIQVQSTSISIREPIPGKTHKTKYNMIYPYYGYKKGKIKTLEEQAKLDEQKRQREILKKQCLNKELTNNERVYSQIVTRESSGSFDISTPIVTASASKGFYIPNSKSHYKGVYTGDHGRAVLIEVTPLPSNEGGKKRDGKALMLKSVQYQFTCGRGSNRLNPNRCTAKGYVQFKEEPIKCAEFLIP